MFKNFYNHRNFSRCQIQWYSKETNNQDSYFFETNFLKLFSSLTNKSNATVAKSEASNGDFSKILKDSIEEINDSQVKGDKAMADLATGEVKDLHQAAIAINKAETSMKMMLEVRNKALSAYKEIARTQI